MTRPRVSFSIDMLIENHTDRDLGSAQVLLQKSDFDLASSNLLIPLRTGVALGRVPAGATTSLKLECVALNRGVASLGEVRVVDPSQKHGTWVAQETYQVFVIGEGEMIPP